MKLCAWKFVAFYGPPCTVLTFNVTIIVDVVQPGPALTGFFYFASCPHNISFVKFFCFNVVVICYALFIVDALFCRDILLLQLLLINSVLLFYLSCAYIRNNIYSCVTMSLFIEPMLRLIVLYVNIWLHCNAFTSLAFSVDVINIRTTFFHKKKFKNAFLSRKISQMSKELSTCRLSLMQDTTFS